MKHLFTSTTNCFSRYVRRGALLLALGAAGPAAWGQSFGPMNTYAIRYDAVPRGIAVADVNGDGKLDVLTANSNTGTLGVLLGNGNGGFALSSAIPTAPATVYSPRPYAVALADVNGDGKLDALVANYGAGTMAVLFGNGLGSFALQPNSPSTSQGPPGQPSEPRSIALADVNGEGRLDALMADEGRNVLVVLVGNGSGGFAQQGTFTSAGLNGRPLGVVVADINADGRPDALTANQQTYSVGMLVGTGQGNFALSGTPTTGGPLSPYCLATADVNGDGRADILTGNLGGPSTMSVFLGDGVGGLALQGNYPTGYNTAPYGVAAADLNGDGYLDAVTANFTTTPVNALTVFRGDGTGSFTASSLNSPVVDEPYNVVLADVNRDGRPDILTTNYGSGTLGVVLNTGTYTPLAARPTAAPDVALAPNPAHDAFSVTLPAGFPPAQAELLNALGQVVRRPAVAGPQFTVPTAGLAPGVYTLRLSTGAGTRTKRVMVD